MQPRSGHAPRTSIPNHGSHLLVQKALGRAAQTLILWFTGSSVSLLQADQLSGSYCGGKGRPSKLSVQETVEGNLLVCLKPGDKDFSKKTLDLYYDDQLVAALGFGSKTHKTYGETLAALQKAGSSHVVPSDLPAGAGKTYTQRCWPPAGSSSLYLCTTFRQVQLTDSSSDPAESRLTLRDLATSLAVPPRVSFFTFTASARNLDLQRRFV